MNGKIYITASRPIKHDTLRKDDAFGKIPHFSIAPICRILTDGERRLFLYYASQANNFAPSFAEIEKHTDLSKSSASRIRVRLAKKGFISFDTDKGSNDRSIRICWDNIRKMKQEMVNKPSDNHGDDIGVSPAPIIDIVTKEGIREKSIIEILKGDRFKRKIKYITPEDAITPLSKNESSFYKSIIKLTESEAKGVIDRFHPSPDNKLPF